MKKIGLALCLTIGMILFSSKTQAQYLFDPTFIHEVEINFYDANWDHKLDSLASLNAGTGSGTGRILANVILDGTSFDSCGVRYKGNSSMDTSSNKNPFNIDLNYVIAGQKYQGKNKIKLANCFTDPSMIREALSYEIANQYMDCPKTNFTKLTINGGYRGLYTNTESIDNEFLTEFYGSENNSFFKCDPNSFELFGDNSNLAYYPDSMAYDTLYDMKSVFGLGDLQALTYQLEFYPNTIGQHLDVDRALWFLAFSSVFVNNDSYTAFAHNFYIYKQDNGRWSIILWDLNMSFGGLLWNGENFLPLGITALQQQDPFLHQAAVNFRPLIGQLLSIPQFNKMYVAHYRTLMEENVNNGYYMQRAQWWHDLIDSEVPNEPYPFFTYQDFIDNLTTDVGTWINMRPGLENLMEARKTYIYTLPEFQASQPIITNINVPVEPNPFSLITFTADVSNATLVQLGYRYNHYDVFTKTTMYDDGAHNDGAAGDGTYGVDVAIQGIDMDYYIYAENATSARFSPARAEYELYQVTPLKGLVINELAADNATIWADLAGDYDDWIELYNNSDDPINLGDYYLSDDAGNLLKWSITSYTLQPGDYFIVWADNDLAQPGVHANFQLSSNGEGLYLSNSLGFLIDAVDFPAQYTDITYGRYPNGTGNFNFLWPTFGFENSSPIGTDEEFLGEMSVYPNPTSEKLNFNFEKYTDTELFIFNLSGQLVRSDKINGNYHQVFVGDLAKGTYIVRLSTGQVSKFVVN